MKTHDAPTDCPACGKSFSTVSNLARHVRAVHGLDDGLSASPVAGPSRAGQGGAGQGGAGAGVGCGHFVHPVAGPSGAGAGAAAGQACEQSAGPVAGRGGAMALYSCIFCREKYASSVELKAHRRLCAGAQARRRCKHRCPRCHVSAFHTRAARDAHVGGCGVRATGREGGFTQPRRGQPKMMWTTRSSFNGVGVIHTLPLRANNLDLNLALIEHKQRLIERLDGILGATRGVRWWLAATVVVTKEKPGGDSGTQVELKFEDKVVRSAALILKPLGIEEIRQQIEESILQVVHRSEHLSVEGSNWSITRVRSLQIGAAHYEPLDASAGSYIPTPAAFSHSMTGVVNIRTDGSNDCFELSVAAGLMPEQTNPNRPQLYRPHVSGLMNRGDIDMRPMKLCDIRKFQDLNPHFSLSVLAATEDKDPKLYPLIAPRQRRDTHVCLLLLSHGEKRHYCLVRDISRFLASQTKHKSRMEVCVYCLSRHTTVELRKCHESLCQQYGAQKTIFAPKGSVLEFALSDYKKMVRPHYVIYYHFDYVARRLAADEPLRQAGPNTTRVVEHMPVSYALIVVNHEGKPVEVVRHSAPEGTEVAEHFIDQLLDLESKLYASRVCYPLHMSDQQRQDVEMTTDCWLCGNRVPDSERALDHCHLTKKNNLKGLSHKTPCNPQRSSPNFIPVVGLGASKTHISAILAALPPYLKGKDPVKRVNVIAREAGEYLGAKLFLKNGRQLHLVDCSQFHDAQVGELRSSALKSNDLPIFSQFYPTWQEADQMKSGFLVPFEPPGSYAELVGTVTLPPREAMTCARRRQAPTDEQYTAAKKIWQTFNCSSLMDFIEEQTFCNVIALAEFFEKFRMQMFKKYEIEPLHFFTTSGFIWTCMLKTTRVKLDLIHDPTMYIFLERSLRGGVQHVSKKWSDANLPGMSTYDPEKEHKSILGFDISNMYASIIQDEKLPCSDFQWRSGFQLSQIDWLNWDADGDEGFTVMCDIQYPKELWQRDDEYPLAPERIAIPPAWWSEEQRHIASLCEISEADRPKKLISHLGPRYQYVVHGKALQYMLRRGLVVSRFHIGVRYKQRNYMGDFMRDLTSQRRDATDECTEKGLKKAICCVFGRATRQPRRDMQYTIESDPMRFKKKAASPWFVGFEVLGSDVVALEMKKKTLRLVEPVYCGVSILDLSKCLAQQSYQRIKTAFPTSSLLMSDTDSFYIETNCNVNDGFYELRDVLDTSELHQRHPMYSLNNRKIPGKLKLEYPRLQIVRYVAPKSRAYCLSMETHSGAPVMVAKCSGINRASLAMQCTYEDFKQCLFTGIPRHVTSTSMRTDKRHRIFTVREKKIALSSFDDKRRLMPDLFNTQAYRPRTQDDNEVSTLDEDDLSLLDALTALLDENEVAPRQTEWSDDDDSCFANPDFLNMVTCIENLHCSTAE